MGRVCVGYRELSDLLFRNETDRVVSRFEHCSAAAADVAGCCRHRSGRVVLGHGLSADLTVAIHDCRERLRNWRRLLSPPVCRSGLRAIARLPRLRRRYAREPWMRSRPDRGCHGGRCRPSQAWPTATTAATRAAAPCVQARICYADALARVNRALAGLPGRGA